TDVIPGTSRTVSECLLDLDRRPAMVELASPELARAWCDQQRAAGHSIGFIPTMGALHEGHLELVRRAARETDRVCVSIFVNPLQFNKPEDLAAYARDFQGDARQVEGAGCAMVFTGTLAQFFPGSSDDGVLPDDARVDPGAGARGLEGEHRPGHLEGVATIVDRLFEVVRPERAYFGRKDYQQTLVVSDLASRHAGLSVVVCPTTRESNGLALSSRNRRLSDAGRTQALAIPRALAAARLAWENGEREPGALRGSMLEVLTPSGLEIEYAEVRDPECWTGSPPTGALSQAVALIAAVADGVRLIDNHNLSEDLPVVP
ncbi:MAG: pantoate--beta-alanine ligase, partial [Planctomycetota bacterium]